MPFVRGEAGARPGTVQDPGGAYGGCHVGSALTLQGGGHGTAVRTGHQTLAALELKQAPQFLAAGVVMVEPDCGAVGPSAEIDAVLVVAAILDVGDGGKRAVLQTELHLEPGPVGLALGGAPGSVGRRVGVHVVDWRSRSGVRAETGQLPNLLVDAGRYQTAAG